VPAFDQAKQRVDRTDLAHDARDEVQPLTRVEFVAVKRDRALETAGRRYEGQVKFVASAFAEPACQGRASSQAWDKARGLPAIRVHGCRGTRIAVPRIQPYEIERRPRIESEPLGAQVTIAGLFDSLLCLTNHIQ